MNKFTLNTTKTLMRLLESLLKMNIKVEGLEHINDGPTLFVVNHFTRFETFILPYVIHKFTNQKVHTLADDSLFGGRFGKFLNSVGVISTQEPGRDRKIIGDLMTGRNNWLIYPEGLMVKNKKISQKRRIMLTTPNRVGPPHTGASILAIKSELFKQKYITAFDNDDANKIKLYNRWFKLNHIKDLSTLNTVIVPVTISYYPLRPGPNILKNLAKVFIKNLPHRVEEELEIEGNLLLRKSDINIYFGEPQDIAGTVGIFNTVNRYARKLVRRFGDKHALLKGLGKRTTTTFMKHVYNNLSINIDHLFCAGLFLCRKPMILQEDYYRALFLTANELKEKGNHRLHESLLDELIKIVSGDRHRAIEEIQDVAYKLRILDTMNGQIVVNRVRLDATYRFHLIRKENPIKVIANELEPLADVQKLLGRYVNMSPRKLKTQVTEVGVQIDLDLYRVDRQRYCEINICKSIETGSPFFLRSRRHSTGIVLAHGFLSAPAEVRPLADFLHSRGFSVYGVRLRGHGTTPENLTNVSWQNWYYSFLRGYVVLRNYCDHVIFGGFSTGGVLALLAAAGKQAKIDGVFAINPPIDLGSIGARGYALVKGWNYIMNQLHLRHAQQIFIDNDPENPDINYDKIYLKAISELKNVMAKFRRSVDKIQVPALILHSDKDPVVSPTSSRRIHSRIPYQEKTIQVVNSNRHVIIRDEGSDGVFAIIDDFLERINKEIPTTMPLA